MAEHCGDVIATAAGTVEGDGDQRAKLALGHGAETEQRHLWHLIAAHLLLDREVPDLGPVAVDDHDPPTIVEQLRDRLRHRDRVRPLLVIGAQLSLCCEGVAAEGDHCGPGHEPSLPVEIEPAPERVPPYRILSAFGR